MNRKQTLANDAEHHSNLKDNAFAAICGEREFVTENFSTGEKIAYFYRNNLITAERRNVTGGRISQNSFRDFDAWERFFDKMFKEEFV